jgi:tetratricopeptide (TPR) repeat protein
MPQEEEIPRIGDWLRQRVFQRFGVWGLVAIAALTGIVLLWTQWHTVKSWPGVAAAVNYLGREALPQADATRFSVAVANFEGDPDNEHKDLVVRLLRDFEGIQVLSFDRTLSVKGGIPEERERLAYQEAQQYLSESRASVLIWGAVLRHQNDTRPDLYLTRSEDPLRRSKQYAIESGGQFHLPSIFWEDLVSLLHLAILATDHETRALKGHYVAERLSPFIDRVRNLLDSGSRHTGWTPESLGATRTILARALLLRGEQGGDASHVREAIVQYRHALNDWSRDRAPLNWAEVQGELGAALSELSEREPERATALLKEAVATYREALDAQAPFYVPLDRGRTQGGLADALARLGEREGGTTLLLDAKVAYEEALKDLTRERSPLDWATAHHNLGNVLQNLAEREQGTARFHEAIASYREALKEHTRERAPLDWAMTQNGLGNTLAELGDRERSAALVKEAVLAFREALKEWTRERLPRQWAMAQTNLGCALTDWGEIENDTARFQEAVAAFQEVLVHVTREDFPMEWAFAQYNLGSVLRNLGERESDRTRLEQAAAAFAAALEVFEASQAAHFSSVSKANLNQTRELLARTSPPKSLSK